MERRVPFGRHDGKNDRANPTRDRFSSDPPFSRASFLPVFPFNQTVVMINSVSLTIIFASSIIVADGGTVISIPQAINLMNAPTFAITQTIIHRTSPVIFMRQTAISLPHMINDGTATIISGSQIIIFEAEIIISVTE